MMSKVSDTSNDETSDSYKEILKDICQQRW